MSDIRMTDPAPSPAGRAEAQRLARVLLAVGLVLLGLFILEGFLRALAWAVILVVATGPLYRRAEARFPPGRHNLVLPLGFTLGATLIFVVPLVFAAIQAGEEARMVAAWVTEARMQGVPLPDALSHLPVLQPQVTAWWATNLADPEGARALLGRLDAELMQSGRAVGARALHNGVLFAFAMVTMFFLYRDAPLLAAQTLTASQRLFGPHGERVGRQILASIHGTVDGLVMVGLGVGLVLGLGYWAAGVPHPVLLGAATAVGAMLPMGATVALAVACLLALGAGHSAAAAALAGLGMVVVFVADHFIRPALIGGATRLPFLWVLLGILGGVETFGLLGLFLGPAVMAALILLWREWVGDATKDPT
jgi:predicted PurR-regulated permease PerM